MPAPDWTPELTDVGAILRARTRSDDSGEELGTFNTTTRPTGAEMQAFIDFAVSEITLRLPDTLDERFQAFVRRLVAIRAAMQAEISLEPDRVNGDDSAYARLKEMFDSGWTSLMDAVGDQGTGGDVLRLVALPLTTPTADASALLVDYDELVP